LLEGNVETLTTENAEILQSKATPSILGYPPAPTAAGSRKKEFLFEAALIPSPRTELHHLGSLQPA
jgi:hypothetical protein